jgi:prepilin-type N-terminal cleavage/methylation domain-containing protein
MNTKRRRGTRSDDGYTLVEMIAAIVIMGLVIAPLCTAMIQSMKLVPTSGDRAQVATDSDRMVRQFSNDVGNAQSLTNGGTQVFNTASTPKWTQNSSGPTGYACDTTHTPPQFLEGAITIFGTSDQGAAGDRTAKTGLWYTRIGSGTIRSFKLRRTVVGADDTVYINAYCQQGDNPVTIETIAPNVSTNVHEVMKLTLRLRDSFGNRLPDITFQAGVRDIQTS